MGCGCPVTVVSDGNTRPERVERAEAAELSDRLDWIVGDAMAALLAY